MSGFNIIVAATNSMGIGRNGTLPWKIKADMDYFKRLTTSTNFTTRKNAVIMGRITYESIPEKFRPLQDRINVVITRNSDLKNLLNIPENVILASSFEDALNILDSPTMGVNEIFVIGGASIYRESIQSSRCKKIYLTLIYSEVNDVDAMFPIIPAHIYTLSSQSELFEENGYSFRFTEYERIDEKSNVSKHEEYQYLGIVKDIIESGSIRGDRTGTGTLSKFGVQMRFSLRQNSFPLLTTKKVFWRGVVEELLWFIQGCTNAKELANRGVHIWDGNGSREYLDRIGFTEREEGDLGPIYGFQWRHFGATYSNMHADYTGYGVDQLLQCVERIKTNPEDRRIIMCAWNPLDIPKMALPPCHVLCQFYVANNELSCHMYQRSADFGLGVPFNIASYALLTVMMAHVTNLNPGEFVHSIGDAHVYLNHVEALKEQLRREPRPFPKLYIETNKSDITTFEFSDFRVVDYQPDASIKMKMAV